jgi:hypothetical protein
LGEKSFKRRKTLHGNQEESRQEKETLSGRMLVQKFPKASQEKHLLRGFSFCGKGGVSAATLAVLGLVMLAGLGISLAGLVRNVRSTI